MRNSIAAPLAAALLSAQPISAQSAAAPAITDQSNARIADGSWTHSMTASGSEAQFRSAGGQPLLVLACLRQTRQVTITRQAAGAAPFLQVWTSSLGRNLLASFNPATGRLTATLGAQDPLLDALAMSRGRIAVGISGQPATVAPAWAEISRIVEDCRG
jgi:hypothetical protein